MYPAMKEAIWRAREEAASFEEFTGDPPKPFAFCDEGRGEQWFRKQYNFYDDQGLYVALKYINLNGEEAQVVYRAYEGGEYGVEWWVNYYADFEALKDWKWLLLEE